MKRLITAVALMLLGACGATLSVHTTASAAEATDCKPYNKTTKYVVCVDVSAQRGSVRSASNGVIGPKVIPTFIVTTSRVDTDGKASSDSITQMGHFMMYGGQLVTSKGLKYYIQFGNTGQGVHYYPTVGPSYDSHGCVRLTMSTATAIWNLLVANKGVNSVAKGVVEIHIYP